MPIKRDTDATTGTKLLRLFQLLLADRHRHYQADLAEWLNCSKQTIIRLTREIENVLGAQLLTGIEGRRRWYQLCPSTRAPLGMEHDELRYLRLCRDMARPCLPTQMLQRVDAGILRIAMLMANSAEDGDGDGGFAFFSKGRIDYTPHFRHIDLLLRAREERRICLVRYRAAGSAEDREHRFVAGRIACMNGALYALGAAVDEDGQLRHLVNLAVHRIRDVRLTGQTAAFSVPEAHPGTFGLPWHEPRRFRIRFAPGKASDYVRERIWAEEQQMEELPDGGVLLEITTRSEPELMSWVRSFGDQAELLPETDGGAPAP